MWKTTSKCHEIANTTLENPRGVYSELTSS